VTTLLLGLALLVVGGLGIALLELLIRRADVAAALVLGSVVVQAYFIDRVPALVLPGGVQVYVTDIVASLVVGAAMLRLLRRRNFDRYHRWLLLLGVLLLVSLVRGVAAFGMQASVADFREYLFFGGAALYFATFPVSIRLYDRIGRIWLAMTIPMMVLVCLRWLAVFAGVNLGVPASKYGADAAIRVIDGPYVFFLAHAFVLTIPAWTWMRRERERWLRWISVLLLLFCLVLNRRTVWLAIVVGVAVLMLRDRGLGRRALVLVAFGGVMTAVAFASFGGLQERSEPLVKSGSGNLSWRVQGWSDLVTEPDELGRRAAVRQRLRPRGRRRRDGLTSARLLHRDLGPNRIRRLGGLRRAHRRAAAGAMAHAGPRRRTARAGGATCLAGHADRLVPDLGAWQRAGHRHRPRHRRGRRVRFEPAPGREADVMDRGR
jgi:hypothetical protein